MAKMNQIGIYVNCDKQKAVEVAERCADFLTARGITPLMLFEHYEICGFDGVKPCEPEVFFSEPECIITLGGDGTLLAVARNAAVTGVPIFGINLGKLGFLTEGDAHHPEKNLRAICSGHYELEERMMLGCDIIRADGRYETYTGMNDVLVKNAGTRMIELMASVDGNHVDTFRADGIIIASPTGSTAYSLAAGGPVVMPGTQVMLLNPICPHRLHDRAYVIPGSSRISLAFPDDTRDAIASIDGQITVPVVAGDRVEVFKSPRVLRLIRPVGFNFFDRLRQKLSFEG